MYVWKVIVKADDFYGQPSTYSYFGVASSASVVMNQALRLAKKQQIGTCRKVASIERLGELDFSTK